MASLNELAKLVALRRGEPFNYILIESIKFSFKYYRAEWIKNDITRNGYSSQYLQKIVVPIKRVSMIDDCNIDTTLLGCTIGRTVNKIPIPIRSNGSTEFKFLGTADGSKAFTYTEIHELEFTKFNKYTSSVIRYALINNYPYIFNDERLKFIAIQTPFENPEQAINLCSSSSESAGCYNDNMEFPLPLDMVRTIINDLVNGTLKIVNDDKQVDTNERKPNEFGSTNQG